MNPVLVTGATGYLGTRLVADLLRDGVPVRAVVRRAVQGVLRRTRPAVR